jgi:hyperosmotically inducible protein
MNMKQLMKTATLVVITGTASLAFAEGYTTPSSGNASPAATQDNRSPAANRDNSSPQANDNRTASQRMEDAAITTRVKAKLAADDRVKATDINVDTMNGIVTLHGNVKSDTAKNAAEEIARQVDGVASIDNQIMTGATAQQKGGSKKAERVASDSWITTKVKSTLLADHMTKGLNIGVKTMNGTVSLSGNVSSQEEFDRAVQVAKNIKGVKNVNTTQLQVEARQ